MSEHGKIWRFPPVNVELETDEVHVWCAPLDHPLSTLRALEKSLSPNEREKARKIASSTERDRYIAGRGQLRLILGRYLSMPPEQIEFIYTRSGKPALKPGLKTLSFNCAHCDKLALYAIGHQPQLGIDLEQIRPIEETSLITSHFFSARENEELRAFTASQKLEAFFHGWTRKEAYMKALGEDLSTSLHQVEVSLDPRDPARLLSIGGASAAQWCLETLVPAPGYVAALAVKTPAIRLSCWQWPENPTANLSIAYRQTLSGQLN